MDEIEDLKKKRFLFLKTLYTKSHGNELTHFNKADIGKNLGFEIFETTNIVDYLSGEGLIKFLGWGGEIGITHNGIIEVEKMLSKPNEQINHFPPLNIINIKHMENSQIQQGSIDSSQVVNLSLEYKNDIKDFLELLKQRKTELVLPDDDESELKAEISTIESQIASSKPMKKIIKESLFVIKNILENAGGSILASELLLKLPILMDLL